jgi:FkbM family methyltransferase
VDFDDILYKTEIIKGIHFLIRKKVLSDVLALKENFIDQQYGFSYPYIQDKVVLDIGAYIADSAIGYCINGAKTVLAYEPHPHLFDIAVKNIELNKLENKIILKNYGVGDKDATIAMNEDGIFGATWCFGSNKIQHGKEVQLKTFSLKRIIEESPTIDVMKMDCEGAEFSAILACPQKTLRKIRVMVIEYHSEPASLISYLEKAGFKVEKKNENVTSISQTGLLFAKLKEADE